MGGGQVRAAHLYRGLSEVFDVEFVTLVDAAAPGGRTQIGPAVWEHRVPKSAAHAERELGLERESGTVVTDIAMTELYLETPDYLAALERAAAGARAVVACHPYVFPAIREVTNIPVWYEAQDVEATLKRDVLAHGRAAQRLLARVEAVERACCEQSEVVWACSAEDCQELIERYGLEPSRVLIVPNGVALDEVSYVPPSTRLERKGRLRMEDRYLALFIASWHQPNLLGARELFRFAARAPEIDVMIVGSAGHAFTGEQLPGNVTLTGTVSVEFKQAVLGIADVAVNPVRSGSGTNLKMLEYFASGTPVISTAFGARGLGVRADEHFIEAEPAAFPAAIRRLRALDLEALESMVRAARKHVERRLSWVAIATELLEALRARYPWLYSVDGGIPR
jgi:glycosyltransferase involved in cell wall biosynthesis